MTLEQAFNAGYAAQTAGRLDEAERFYRAILKATDHPESSVNLAVVLNAQLRDTEAEQVLREALGHAPDVARLQWQLSLTLLKQGRYSEAWPLFEGRTWNDPNRRPKLSFPEWTGQPISSLLILAEQGLGDQIQYARYAPVLRARGVEVTMVCHPALAGLFSSLDVKIIVAQGSIDIPRHDAWILPASLPLRMGTTTDNIPTEPYLPSREGGQGVGFIGAGNPKHVDDANRSLPADKVAQVLSWPGVRSLEPRDTGVSDVAGTAEIIKGLDLVISADTMVAHLAGAMGKPVWLLLPYSPDWRWMRGRADSPWYPSMRIFRQGKRGDWDGVLADVKAALAARGNGG
jgi:hypothetical protein